MKIRTKPTRDEPVDERYVLMRFGDLVIDPRLCPRGIRLYTHYRRDLNSNSAVNAVCGCPPVEAIA